jgi:hypothetical protein
MYLTFVCGDDGHADVSCDCQVLLIAVGFIYWCCSYGGGKDVLELLLLLLLRPLGFGYRLFELENVVNGGGGSFGSGGSAKAWT